jgi:hypothetical protein
MVYRILAFSLLLCNFLTSCSKPVEIELPAHQSKIILNALINPSHSICILVSKSLPVNSSEEPLISNAKLQLFEDGNIIEEMALNSPGIYCSQIKPKLGSKYKIIAFVEGLEQAEAMDIIPNDIPINSLLLLDSVGVANDPDNLSYYSQIKLILPDPPNEVNFYEIKVYTTRQDFPGDIFVREVYTSDSSVNAEKYDNVNYGNILFSDRYFDGKSYSLTIDFKLNKFEKADEVFLEFNHISYEYYKYHKSIRNHNKNKTGEFWTPSNPVDLYSNVKNGYGIIAGYSSQVYVLK